MGFSVLGVHVNEIYPTRVRGIALGTCITVSRLGAIVSPFAHDQVRRNTSIAPSIFFCVSVTLDHGTSGFLGSNQVSPQETINENILNSLACLVALFLVVPLRETYGKPLPDKFEDADDDPSTQHSTISN